jgi:hypothetical protein
MRIGLALTFLLISVATAYYAEPYAHDNSDLVLIVTTVFTVFAGFLVATITILGDPSLVPTGSWRIVESRRDNVERDIIFHSWLFVLYLITIALIFASVVVRKVPCDIVACWIKTWIERGYLFVGVFSFLVSFTLPFALHKIQMKRLDEETERRRISEGIEPSNR